MPDAPKPYDVFLSHSHADAEFVNQLAEHLEDKHGLEVWLDRWLLPAGQSWQRGMADGLERAASCVVCVGEGARAHWFQQEVDFALNRKSTDAVTNHTAEAEPLMRRALAIAETSLGPDHPQTILYRENLEALLRARTAEC